MSANSVDKTVAERDDCILVRDFSKLVIDVAIVLPFADKR